MVESEGQPSLWSRLDAVKARLEQERARFDDDVSESLAAMRNELARLERENDEMEEILAQKRRGEAGIAMKRRHEQVERLLSTPDVAVPDHVRTDWEDIKRTRTQINVDQREIAEKRRIHQAKLQEVMKQAGLAKPPPCELDPPPAKETLQSDISASKYCHICGRHCEENGFLCVNAVKAVKRCRKRVCAPCGKRYDLDQNPTSFECPHCRNDCPPSARCKVYAKTNAQRRMRERAE